VIVLFTFIHIDQLPVLATSYGRAAGICAALLWGAADQASRLLCDRSGIVVKPACQHALGVIFAKLRVSSRNGYSLRLDGDAVNAMLVHDRPDAIRHIHIFCAGRDHHVDRCDHGRFR
jgi:hypothetical protein